MIYFSGAKINLGLHVISKRNDGFHDIESIFYPVPIYDVIEVINNPSFQFSYSGVPYIEGVNLVEKAYQLLKKNYPIPSCKIHLHKNIPIGAGLAGGSANGTQTLLALNRQFNLNVPLNKLHDFALQLGSDCPFFIDNTPKLVTGRGEHLKNISLNLNGYYLFIVNPKIHISTKEAYQNLALNNINRKPINSIENTSVDNWKHILSNDFEEYAFKQYPIIKNIKEYMYQNGAVFASMTGTGSTVFGIFKDKYSELTFPKDYYTKWIKL